MYIQISSAEEVNPEFMPHTHTHTQIKHSFNAKSMSLKSGTFSESESDKVKRHEVYLNS
jgi:hypothetical protein